VRYAPSSQLLQLTQNQQRPDFSNLFAIQNPNDDLYFTDIEVETIRQNFPYDDVLVRGAARKTVIDSQCLRVAHCVHISCHGSFNFMSPLESALVLADAYTDKYLDLEKCLILGEIFGLDLSQCRLVTLSACETGLTDPTSLSDEYIGLSSAFLYAGSLSVVSSLWAVNDLSTAFLMIKFYQNLWAGASVAVALNQAQLWLRDVTSEKLKRWIEENRLMLSPTHKINIRRLMSWFEDDEQPFREPFYWAAFCAVGQ
jgi:CHAT domain-containing protein